MRNSSSPELGDRVKDPITGFVGIVVCQVVWLNGCIRLGIQSEQLHEGKASDEVYFDQSRVEIVEKTIHEPLVMEVVRAPVVESGVAVGGPIRESSGMRPR